MSQPVDTFTVFLAKCPSVKYPFGPSVHSAKRSSAKCVFAQTSFS